MIFKAILEEVLFGVSKEDTRTDGMTITEYIVSVLDDIILIVQNPLELATSLSLTNYNLNPTGVRMKKKVKLVKKKILEIFNRSYKTLKPGEKTNTFIGALCDFKRRKPGVLTDDLITGCTFLFIFAGYDTSRHSTGWALHYLSRHQEDQKVLRKEAEAAETFDKIDTEKLEKSPELKAFLQESLRVGAPFGITEMRKCIKDCKIGEVQFKKGDFLNVCLMLNHFREDQFTNPFKFDRSRHYSPKYERMSYIPFGSGRRGCIGKYLAQMNIKIILLVMMKMFEVESSDEFDYSNGALPFHTLNKVQLRLRPRS